MNSFRRFKKFVFSVIGLRSHKRESGDRLQNEDAIVISDLGSNTNATRTQLSTEQFMITWDQFLEEINENASVITGFSLVGTVLTATLADGSSNLTVDLAPIASAGNDGVVTAANMNVNSLELTRSIGGLVTVDLSQFVNDGVISGASLLGTVLTITRTVGGDITVDLASIDTDTNNFLTGVSLLGTVITFTRSGLGDLTLDIASALPSPDGVVTAAAMNSNTLELTRSVGGLVTVDLSQFVNDGTVTAANMNGDTLELTRSVGGLVTVDLSQFNTTTSPGGNNTSLQYNSSGNFQGMVETVGFSSSDGFFGQFLGATRLRQNSNSIATVSGYSMRYVIPVTVSSLGSATGSIGPITTNATTAAVKITAHARSTDGTESKIYIVEAAYRRNGGTLTKAGENVISYGDAALTAILITNPSGDDNSIEYDITGDATDDTYWLLSCEFILIDETS